MVRTNTFHVVNKNGIHARPSTTIVKLANTFKSDITLHFDGESVDGKSIIGVMLLAAGKGSEIKVTANGNDADIAVEEIGKLITTGFGEE